MLCLARAYGDEPLRRLVAGTAHRLVYVLNPDLEDAADDAGVGFPDDAVFAFDAALYDRLQQAFLDGDRAGLWALWQTAQPLRLEMADA